MKVLKVYFFAITSILSLSASAGILVKLPWNVSNLNVCFAGKGTNVRVQNMQGEFANWNKEDMDYVRKVVESEYSKERTGYRFVGFNECQKDQKVDVVILRKSAFSPYSLKAAGSATAGVQGIPPVKEFRHARGVVILTSTGLRRSTITHEFGHILGLMHEHEHPNAYREAQERCRFYNKKNVANKNYDYTQFDEVSVMNYCQTTSDRDSGLSLGDIEAIQLLYKKANLDAN